MQNLALFQAHCAPVLWIITIIIVILDYHAAATIIVPSLPAFVLRFSKTPTHHNKTETDMKQNGETRCMQRNGNFFFLSTTVEGVEGAYSLEPQKACPTMSLLLWWKIVAIHCFLHLASRLATVVSEVVRQTKFRFLVNLYTYWMLKRIFLLLMLYFVLDQLVLFLFKGGFCCIRCL